MTPRKRAQVLSALWNIIIAAIGVVVVVMIAGDERHVFDLKERTVFWAAVVGAGAPAIDSALRASRRVRGFSRAQAENRVQLAIAGALSEIADERAVSIRHLGASVWAIRYRYRPRECWWRPTKHLVRGLRFRLRDNPQPTKVSWTKGKGAVGRAWEKGRPIYEDWTEQSSRWSSPDLTEHQFKKLREKQRAGFTFEEFVRISPKYSEVLAVPITSEGGETLGVISVDVTAAAGVPRRSLAGDDVEGIVVVAASLAREDVRRLYPQE